MMKNRTHYLAAMTAACFMLACGGGADGPSDNGNIGVDINQGAADASEVSVPPTTSDATTPPSPADGGGPVIADATSPSDAPIAVDAPAPNDGATLVDVPKPEPDTSKPEPDEATPQDVKPPKPTKEDACEKYCELIDAACQENNAIEFKPNCMEACMLWPIGKPDSKAGDSIACRIYHAKAALEDPDTHCPHASPDGGGVCTDEQPPFEPEGACTNEKDQKIVDSTDVEGISKDCSIKFLGDAKKATQCIQDSTGLSNNCVACFGTINECAMKSCLIQCLDPSSAKCLDCVDKACMPAFEECSGLSTE